MNSCCNNVETVFQLQREPNEKKREPNEKKEILMKKTLMICAVVVLALGVVAGVSADGGEKNCDKSAEAAKTSGCSKDAEASKAKAEGGCCPSSAAKAAYDKAYEATGCEENCQGFGERRDGQCCVQEFLCRVRLRQDCHQSRIYCSLRSHQMLKVCDLRGDPCRQEGRI